MNSEYLPLYFPKKLDSWNTQHRRMIYGIFQVIELWWTLIGPRKQIDIKAGTGLLQHNADISTILL